MTIQRLHSVRMIEQQFLTGEEPVLVRCSDMNAYKDCLKRSQHAVQHILDELPQEWHVPATVVEDKLRQLFVEPWTRAAWENFMDNLHDNIK